MDLTGVPPALRDTANDAHRDGEPTPAVAALLHRRASEGPARTRPEPRDPAARLAPYSPRASQALVRRVSWYGEGPPPQLRRRTRDARMDRLPDDLLATALFACVRRKQLRNEAP